MKLLPQHPFQVGALFSQRFQASEFRLRAFNPREKGIERAMDRFGSEVGSKASGADSPQASPDTALCTLFTSETRDAAFLPHGFMGLITTITLYCVVVFARAKKVKCKGKKMDLKPGCTVGARQPINSLVILARAFGDESMPN